MGQVPLADHRTERQTFLWKFADRDGSAIEYQRRQDDVDAAAVGKPGVDHRTGFVDATTNSAGDTLRDIDEMVGITKSSHSLFELATSLDIDIKRSVRQDIGDFVVIKKRLERPQPDHVVAEVGSKRGFLEFVELNPVLGRDLADQLRDFSAQPGAWNLTRDSWVDSGHQNGPDPLFQLIQQERVGY